ncbi:phosphate acyltransferase [Methylocucumis oryzae]|uniref:phosphate acyltransferase n=1 Tax=Methylocucumis oryzae TaxID=1632867 RepID=UPI0030844B79
MNIPVFHDDQHGTAIIVSAAILNGLQVVGKSLDSCKLVVSGAGAAALACLELLVDLGFPLANIFVCDLAGVVYQGRTELMDEEKARYAQATDARTLADIISDADVFLGLSAGGVLTQAMVKKMASKPIILALANPRPEIMPEEIRAVRDDAIIATGRSDYPNQVNNVLCFPYVFRGALDCGATTITRSMEIAAVHALAALAQAEQSDLAAAAYDNHHVAFGENHLIPLPFDPRLMSHIAPAVARAAMEAGVATRPIEDLTQYAQKLSQFAYHSGSFMQPIFNNAKKTSIANKRIVFTEGEDERVLRAVQIILDEQLAKPILIGRPHTIKHLLKQFGLRFRLDSDVTVISPDLEGLYDDFWRSYWLLAQRKGITESAAQLAMRRQHTLIGAMLVKKGFADGMICGTSGEPGHHLHEVDLVLGKRAGASVYAAMNYLLLADRQIALVDTHFNQNPSAAELAEITLLAAEQMRHFGLPPRVALLSHSNFGSHQHGSASKMREVLALVKQFEPELEN